MIKWHVGHTLHRLQILPVWRLEWHVSVVHEPKLLMAVGKASLAIQVTVAVIATDGCIIVADAAPREVIEVTTTTGSAYWRTSHCMHWRESSGTSCRWRFFFLC